MHKVTTVDEHNLIALGIARVYANITLHPQKHVLIGCQFKTVKMFTQFYINSEMFALSFPSKDSLPPLPTFFLGEAPSLS